MAERKRQKTGPGHPPYETLSEAYLARAIDGIHDYAIFLLTPDGRVASWNAGAQKLKGYEASEIIGRHFSAFYPTDDVQAGVCERQLELATATGHAEAEGWRKRKDGTRFWARAVLTAVREGDGAPVAFVKVTTDLSERRSMEEALRESEERLRLLIESVKDYAIFMLDTAGMVVTWNAGAERIKGYSAQEIIGRHFSTFYVEEEATGGKPALELHTAATQGRYEEEGWRVRRDGSRFWANVVLTAIHKPGGKLVGFAKVTRDLTERRRLDEERLRAAQAEEAIRLRDEFLSIASHELKTPLAAMQLQLETLKEKVSALDAKMGQRVERAARSGERLSELIEMLLDVSRIATGRLDLRRSQFDLNDAVVEVVERLQESATQAGCELAVNNDGAVLGFWDRLRLEQVVTNLVSNSIKYAAGTPISIAITRDVSHVIMEVQDRGPGINVADMPRLFGRFERAASTRHYGGLGLGLYVTRQIVEAHGGQVTVQNSDGGGALFVVRLPLTQAADGPVTAGEAR